MYDVLVNLIVKAIDTGSEKKRAGNETFYYGRSSAFVDSSARVGNLMYGVDYQAGKDMLNLRVRDVRAGWSAEDLRDEAKVGAVATEIATDMIETVKVAV